ncbi:MULTISPECIES: hypothetical protein [Nitrosomonas]|uniref:Uncharacterized protein n=1 Tax=Nitrosomonas communis TaxID=44574 RepID=A0A0F7KGK0_9PROT|nr:MULTISPECIES: hypothetical protein [Nitrosomonas]AKH38641.1 hypothetical protein AAW31_13850 [Nitrosomonas communis]TYP83735.1 hypothetical protein BCL69_10429 [Nitrosomonas communis]UVS60710.1 hypothetical protein NX761_14575 [Nitrosomonas sp. PLL12]
MIASAIQLVITCRDFSIITARMFEPQRGDSMLHIVRLLLELMPRLAALAPQPRLNLIRSMTYLRE